MQINIVIKYHVLTIRFSQMKNVKLPNIHNIDKQWVFSSTTTESVNLQNHIREQFGNS